MHSSSPVRPGEAEAASLEALQQCVTRAIRAISIDLDDTLWPIWPTIARAEAVLLDWLGEHAQSTATYLGDTDRVRALRHEINALRPDLAGDPASLRRESIRLALTRADEDTALAEPAFEVFMAERQRVQLYDDALPALEFLARRWPVVALSNGNADVQIIGIGRHFQAALSATGSGMAKPDARFFRAAAEAVGVAPEHVLHIGDDAELDAKGAMDAGMRSLAQPRAVSMALRGAEPHVTVASLWQLCQGLADR